MKISKPKEKTLKRLGGPASTLPQHAHPLVREAFQLMIDNGYSVNKVSAKAGLANAAVDKWRTKCNPSLVSLEAFLNVMGKKLAIVDLEITIGSDDSN